MLVVLTLLVAMVIQLSNAASNLAARALPTAPHEPSSQMGHGVSAARRGALPCRRLDRARLCHAESRLHPAAASRQFLLGTDELGRDNLSRLLTGLRLSLWLATAGAACSCALALLFGALSGFAGGWIETTFPAPIADFVSLFDQLPILSGQSKLGTKAVLGPFMIKDYKPGIELFLVRNPNYWKSDAQGHRLPYLDSVRLPIQQNRETELARFRRTGDVQLIDTIDPAIFDQLARDMPDAVRDAGPLA